MFKVKQSLVRTHWKFIKEYPFKVLVDEKVLSTEIIDCFSTSEVAGFLNVSRYAVRYRRDKGLIPFFKMGSKIYYPKVEIQQMLNINHEGAFAIEAE